MNRRWKPFHLRVLVAPQLGIFIACELILGHGIVGRLRAEEGTDTIPYTWSLKAGTTVLGKITKLFYHALEVGLVGCVCNGKTKTGVPSLVYWHNKQVDQDQHTILGEGGLNPDPIR